MYCCLGWSLIRTKWSFERALSGEYTCMLHIWKECLVWLNRKVGALLKLCCLAVAPKGTLLHLGIARMEQTLAISPPCNGRHRSWLHCLGTPPYQGNPQLGRSTGFLAYFAPPQQFKWSGGRGKTLSPQFCVLQMIHFLHLVAHNDGIQIRRITYNGI